MILLHILCLCPVKLVSSSILWFACGCPLCIPTLSLPFRCKHSIWIDFFSVYNHKCWPSITSEKVQACYMNLNDGSCIGHSVALKLRSHISSWSISWTPESDLGISVSPILWSSNEAVNSLRHRFFELDLANYDLHSVGIGQFQYILRKIHQSPFSFKIIHCNPNFSFYGCLQWSWLLWPFPGCY